MIKRGILWSGFHNMSFSHTDKDIAYALLAYKKSLSYLKTAIKSKNIQAFLIGEPVEAVFRIITDFKMKQVLK